ncbi:MAG: exodeoxyribonuclease VII large subunit [Odoribacter splanchnicus]
MMEAISLYELNNRIKQTLKASFADSVWITAEITEVQLNRSGHCYLQLADKREQEDSIVATAWDDLAYLSYVASLFRDDNRTAVEKGMKVP